MSGFGAGLAQSNPYLSADSENSEKNGDQGSALWRIGEEHMRLTPGQRHAENLSLKAPAEKSYLANQNYTMEAQGSGISATDGTEIEMRVSLEFSIWKSTPSLVWMDIMNGTVEIGDETLLVRSGAAYYLANMHQLRIAAFVAGSGADDKAFQILIMKAKLPSGALPSPDSADPVLIEVLSPQSKLLPGWLVKLNGETKLVSPSVAAEKAGPIVLTAILDLGSREIFHSLLNAGLERLRENHPDLDIRVDEKYYEYPSEKTALMEYVKNGTAIDLFSADQIWLGELVDMGLLTDLTSHTESWGRASDWYQTNWDGGGYKGKTYGIWIWTDVRGIYYWKDLLAEAGVDPESLRTWSGYIAAGQKLNAELRPRGIEGIHLTGVGHSPDLWYPYLWMLGGQILEQRPGNPVHGEYWFPAYNSSAGVEALTFIRDQVAAGIVPQRTHEWGQEFADRKFAVMIEASHVPAYFQPMSVSDLDNQVGYLPFFPVPNSTSQTATLMGGWELAVPETSANKELSWELISIMTDPEILSPLLAKYNYLPTQLPIGQGSYSQELRATNPFFDEMASLIQYGHGRPSIPEYPQIAEHIREAIDAVYTGQKEPKQALDDAAAKSARALGWTE